MKFINRKKKLTIKTEVIVKLTKNKECRLCKVVLLLLSLLLQVNKNVKTNLHKRFEAKSYKYFCVNEVALHFRIGFNSRMNNTSCNKQSKLFLNFLRTLKYLSGSFGNIFSLVVVVFMYRRWGLFLSVSVLENNLHNPHLTVYIENDTLRVFVGRSVALFLGNEI